MKTNVLPLVVWFILGLISTSKSQSIDTTINLNLLRGPASPAANLLGISPNDIQRPADVTGFAVSLQNATQGFSALPNNFAVDVAPYWTAGSKGRNLSFKDFNSNKNSIAQTFVLSAGINSLKRKNNTDSTLQAGLGFRFSVFRGKFDSAELNALAKNLRDDRQKRLEEFEKLEQQNQEKIDEIENTLDLLETLSSKPNKSLADSLQLTLLPVVKAQRQALIDSFTDQARDKVKAQLENEKKNIENKPLQRFGGKLDIAGGIAWDFPGIKFDSAQVLKAGLWVTGGVDYKDGCSFLGIIRYLYNPDKIFADTDGKLKGRKGISTLDFGARFNRQAIDSPFAWGTELIYRSVLDKNTLPSSWRWTVNLNYEVAKNTIVTLTFGRDFDKTFKNDGSVIGLLNLVKGFGSTRSL